MTAGTDSDTWTIRRVLSWTAKDFSGRGIDTARLDAELLVARALELDRVGLYLDLDRPLDRGELGRIRALVKRRRDREPVAYILGTREFYGRSFDVGPAVLVPRPDTETLVDRALQVIDVLAGEGSPPTVLDLCTGSGAIAVTLAAERPALHVDATDVSTDALEVARRNAEHHGVADRLEWFAGDLFEAVPAGRTYGLIVANPPYIADPDLAGLEPEVSEWEPRLALAAGPEGLAVIARIAQGAAPFLEPGGHLLTEIGAGQAEAVVKAFESDGLTHVATHRDLAGIDRVVEVRR